MTKALVPLAEGAEEMECVIVIDTLRRANWEVTLASIADTPSPVLCSRGVRIIPDTTWQTVKRDAFDMLILPGGNDGARHLAEDPRILETVQRFASTGKIVAAICAAPLVLQSAGILEGRHATCHPLVAEKLTAPTRLDDPVVCDGNIVTSQGPGTAFVFALTLIRLVDGTTAAATVADGLIV